ncbi:MAG: helix-turn-helix domain-containing protein [Candidatus Omnitrophota bacterium]
MENRAELRKTIAARLKTIRRERDMTQDQFVSAFDIGRANYSRCETGEIFPNCLVLYQLCTEFDISLNWLIGDVGPMHINDLPERDQDREREEDIELLIRHLDRIPVLYHRVMALFQEFLIQNRDMVRDVMKK